MYEHLRTKLKDFILFIVTGGSSTRLRAALLFLAQVAKNQRRKIYVTALLQELRQRANIYFHLFSTDFFSDARDGLRPRGGTARNL